jgi:hypothetical protein
MQKKFSNAWLEEQAKRECEITDWKDRVTMAAVVLAQQLLTLESYLIPYNVAKPLSELQKIIEDKPLPLLKTLLESDWEEVGG